MSDSPAARDVAHPLHPSTGPARGDGRGAPVAARGTGIYRFDDRLYGVARAPDDMLGTHGGQAGRDGAAGGP